MQGIFGQYAISIYVEGNPLPLNTHNLEKMYLVESINNFLPTLHLEYLDNNNIFDQQYPLLGDDNVELYIGQNTPDIATEGQFINGVRFLVYNFKVTPSHIKDAYLYHIDCVHIAQDGMFQPAITRAFRSKTSSEVFQNIIADMGFETGDVESTDDRQTWIQASWDNATMIRHLISNARAIQDRTGLLCYGNRDSKFSYCTYEHLIKKQPTARLSYAIDVRSVQVAGIDSENDTMSSYLSGASGATAQYFDYSKKQFKTEPFDITDCSRRDTLPDSIIRRERLKGDNISVYFGTNTDNSYKGRHEAYVKNIISGSFTGMQKISCLSETLSNIHIGDVVDFSIPFDSSSAINKGSAGLWVVYAINTAIKDRVYRRYTLTRSCINPSEEKVKRNNLVTL